MDLVPRKACKYKLRPHKTVPCYYYGNKRMKKTKWDDIPEDLKRLILLKLSAETIYNVMPRVCTYLRHTILHDSSFINAHLRHSNRGIIFKSLEEDGCLRFIEATNPDGGRLVLENHTLAHSRCHVICASSNGLVLTMEYKYDDGWKSYLLNPVTKQKAILPILGLNSSCKLGYVASSSQYKIVKCGYPFYDKVKCIIKIITLGPNQEWRDLYGSPHTIKGIYSNGGVIQWIEIAESRLLALNLETEACQELPYPQALYHKEFLVMGDQLSIVKHDSDNKLCFEIWVLGKQDLDYVWRKAYDIDLQQWTCTFQRCSNTFYWNRSVEFSWIGWLRPAEVVAFSIGMCAQICIAYDIKTRTIHPFRMSGNSSLHSYPCTFVKSWVSPKAIWPERTKASQSP